jgi:hypothetical protein
MRNALRLLSSLFLLAGSPLAATSYVAMSDEALSDESALIVEARVVGRESAPQWRRPSTDYLIEVDRVLKGSPAGSTLVVRVLGGERPDGVGLRVYGAPRFAEGDRALLFLRPGADGAYRVTQFMLGAFHRVEAEGRSFWMRDLSETSELRLRQDGGLESRPGSDRPRAAGRFSDWLAARAQGSAGRPDYASAVSASTLRNLRREFTLLADDSDNLNIRWFQFDARQPVRWRSDAEGQPGLPGGGHSEFQRALSVWNADSATNVNYAYEGTTDTSGGLDDMDGKNSIKFDVAQDSPFRCGSGGTLAVGGPWYDGDERRAYKGRQVHPALEADIETNTGIDCYFNRQADDARRATLAEELFGHELGHTLGLGHSSEDENEGSTVLAEALMYYSIHGDGRGARLNSDDLSALRQLYGAGSSGGGNQPCKASSTTLCLQKSRFRVEAFFQNQFDGSSGSARAIKSTDVAGFFYFYDKSNFELMIKMLDFGDVIKVFYGELTNLHFTITVTDTRTGQVKTYSNTAGDCGGIDQAAFSHALVAPAQAPGSLKARPAPAGSCKNGPNTLCFLNGRFKAEVDWRNQFDGRSGKAGGIRSSDVTGLFYFTDASNIELVVKMLDFGGPVKLFYGALSDLEYTLHVTDLSTGVTKDYFNPAGRFCGGLDDNAF